MGKLANSIARDIASPAVKMGNRSLFPGVAVPLAFFGTFFRAERKYDPPSGRQPHRPRRSRRVRPHRQKACACGPRRLAEFSHRAASPITRAAVGASDPAGRRPAPAGAPKGFPRGKQSARFALPCAPLVVCLNDRSLTAFGGCIHWIPASLRSPLETFGARRWRKNKGTATIALAERLSLLEANKGIFSGHTIGITALPCAPLAVCLPKPIRIPRGGVSILRAETDKLPPITQNPRRRPFPAAGVFLPLAGRIA